MKGLSEHMPWYWKPRAAAFPLLVVGLLVVINGLVQASFIQCKIIRCEPYLAWHIFEFAEGAVVALDSTSARMVPNLALIETDSTTWANETVVRQTVRRRHTSRMLWAVVAATNAVLCVVVLGYCLFVVLSRVRQARSRRLDGLAGVLVVLSVGIGYLLYSFPESHMYYVLDVFREMDRLSRLPGTISAPDVVGSMNLLNVLNFMAVLFMVVTSSVLTFIGHAGLTRYFGRPDANLSLMESGVVETGLADLSALNKALRLLLNLGTLLLVAGTFRMSAGLSWSAAFVTEQSLAQVEVFTTTLTTIMGAYFSLVLAAIYAPAAYVIKRRALSMAGLLNNSEEATDQLLARTGLDYSVKDTTLRIVTIVSPLLSGPIGSLLGTLNP